MVVRVRRSARKERRGAAMRAVRWGCVQGGSEVGEGRALGAVEVEGGEEAGVEFVGWVERVVVGRERGAKVGVWVGVVRWGVREWVVVEVEWVVVVVFGVVRWRVADW